MFAKIVNFGICVWIVEHLSRILKIFILNQQNVLIIPISANGMDKMGIYLLKSVEAIAERPDLFPISKKLTH